jgi:hypothetical protein
MRPYVSRPGTVYAGPALALVGADRSMASVHPSRDQAFAQHVFNWRALRDVGQFLPRAKRMVLQVRLQERTGTVMISSSP